MKKNQKGFSAVESILIVVILGLIGFVGWYVYNTKNNTDKSYTDAQTTSQKSSVAVVKKAAAPYATTFSKVPKDLQVAIVDQLKKDVPMCVKNDQPVNFEGATDDPPVDYAPSGYAGTGIGCDGGSWGIFAKDSNGNWKFLAKTQLEFDCEVLIANHFPKALLQLNTSTDVKCFDKDDQPAIPYNG